MACLNPDYCGTGDIDTICDDCSLDANGLMISQRKAQALARVLNDQWINRDDMEAMDVVREVCEFANPTEKPKPLEKRE